MGLDFYIMKKRKGEAYRSDNWEETVYGRNCWSVRELVLDNISTYDSEKQEAELTIGTLNNLLIKLSENLKNYNLNDEDTFLLDDYTKLLDWISQLAKTIKVHCYWMENGIEYEYMLIDSY